MLGRSGTPIGSAHDGPQADCLLVLGASFSNHTGIATWVPTIQVDFDRMTLGKFHPVEVPLWGDIGRTLGAARRGAPGASSDPALRAEIAQRRARLGAPRRRAARASPTTDGRLHPALVFDVLGRLVPDDAVIAVDVGNNTYAFGHYFECRGRQDVLMSGYLGSIGFGVPGRDRRLARPRAASGRVIAVTGDGGFGQYLAEFTTAVAERMPITHVLLNNDELGKISREQISAHPPGLGDRPRQPRLRRLRRVCGGRGFKVDRAEQLAPALAAALAVRDRPALVEIRSSAHAV